MTDPNPARPSRWHRFRAHAAVLLVAGFIWFALAEMLPLMGARKLLGQPPAYVKALVEIDLAVAGGRVEIVPALWRTRARHADAGEPGLARMGRGCGLRFPAVQRDDRRCRLLGGFSVQGVGGMGDLWPMLGMARSRAWARRSSSAA
jgi:hypothetical protein